MNKCEGNWVESSCTNLFIYSYAKAIRMGVIGREYGEVLEKAYKGALESKNDILCPIPRDP